MAEHIPIITGEDGGSLVKKYYGDSELVRIQIERAEAHSLHIPNGSKAWVDPCVDGCDDIEVRRTTEEKKNRWFEFMKALPHFEKMGSQVFHSRPVQGEVDAFVEVLMNRCSAIKPAWITVPQLPMCDGSERNKINRSLAKAAGKWKSSSKFSGRLILPLVFTHQEQTNGKTSRNTKVQQADQCYHDSQADGFWAVDKSLIDDSGSGTLRSKRYPGVISLHEELNDRIPSKIRVGGPYWGLNIVLWAKGLIDYPLCGMGSGYQFFLSGGFASNAKAKIAIPSLRRRVSVTPKLSKWFDAAIGELDKSHPAHSEFVDLQKRLTILSDAGRARDQVAKFYKNWFDRIASVNKAGRSLALFQDLAAAYTLGKALPHFEDEGTARRPEAIAEPLMLSCL